MQADVAYMHSQRSTRPHNMRTHTHIHAHTPHLSTGLHHSPVNAAHEHGFQTRVCVTGCLEAARRCGSGGLQASHAEGRCVRALCGGAQGGFRGCAQVPSQGESGRLQGCVPPPLRLHPQGERFTPTGSSLEMKALTQILIL